MKNAQEWFDEGRELAKSGQYKKAIQYYDEALKLNPENQCEILIFKAGAFSHLGCYEDALSNLEKALDAKPNDKTALFFKGIVLHQLGRYREAYKAYGVFDAFSD